MPCFIRSSRTWTSKFSSHCKTPTPKRLTAAQPATATAPAPEQQNQSLRTGSRTNPIHHSPCAQSLGINLQSNSSQSVEYSAHDEGNTSNRLSATPAREGKSPRQPWLHPAEKPGHATTSIRPFRLCRTFASSPSRLGTSFYIIRDSSIPPFRLRPAPKSAPPAPASLTLPLGRVQRVYKGGSRGTHAYFPCTPAGLPMYSPCTWLERTEKERSCGRRWMPERRRASIS